ncbi:hypothetical protein BKA25_001022 [Actinoalloteichus hymeniacidonis]|uniref:Uncharacterized protein n=1 Tax=Actinoalloteichus hymeniacidonis TaxID=340345 RepID=A0AAC9HTT5_9PSEU|nr:hypothetical protein TL08_22160 [Actinoalloteichus hymeniacidonis]MBB5906706.1 hypothetical protein [Actinoalloteichus hymeniacidonis]
MKRRPVRSPDETPLRESVVEIDAQETPGSEVCGPAAWTSSIR